MRWARNGMARWARARSRTEPDSAATWTIRRRRPLRTGGGPRRNRRMTRSTRCWSVSTRSSTVFIVTGAAGSALIVGGLRQVECGCVVSVYYPSAVGMNPIVDRVRAFVDAEVRPVAAELEHADRYPHALVIRMGELGLFGALVPVAYGGL